MDVLSGCGTLSTAALAVVVYFVLLAVYRLTLHPLAKYPGPFVSKVTGWSIPLQCLTGDRHLIHLREHRKYGPVVRIGPNTLSFSSPIALRQIYQTAKENNPLRKSAYYDTIDAPSGAYSIHSETSCARHAARRRVLDHAFTAAALRSNEPYIVEAVDLLCRVVAPDVGEEWSRPRDMADHASWFAYDVMGALVFGRKFNCLTETDHRFVSRMVITSSAFLYIASHLPCQWLVRPLISSPTLMNLFGGQLARDEHAFVRYATECLTQRLDAEQAVGKIGLTAGQTHDKKDLMHYIISAPRSTESAHYGRKEMEADATLLIAAGSDTTSVTISALFFYLTLPSSKPILSKLTTEIRSKFNDVDSIAGAETTSLPYLRACVDEALRLAPPAPIHLPRTVARIGGLEIDGHHIPAGIEVGAAAYVLHHDENIYPDSWSFSPGRWIADRQSDADRIEQITRARQAFVPFSLGSRGCIGRDLAYRELSICIARIVYLFDFRRATPTDPEPGRKSRTGKVRAGLDIRDDEYQVYDCFLVDRDGPEIEFRRRKDLLNVDGV